MPSVPKIPGYSHTDTLSSQNVSVQRTLVGKGAEKGKNSSKVLRDVQKVDRDQKIG